jgi:putative ABC transport system substrate-binding protein
MRRREFITLISGAAAVWPFGASARQPAMPVIGLLGSATASEWAPHVSAFHQGLGDYVEGGNVVIEARWGQQPVRATAGHGG